jgi:hypothetical protein
MQIRNAEAEVLPVKDGETERPIPSAWRTVFREVVRAFVDHDYSVKAGVPGLVPISKETASQIETYIQGYGETLVELPEETWESSVCIWMGNRWDVLIDLWTRSEGRSDLVLSAHVSQCEGGFVFHIYMVYVP